MWKLSERKISIFSHILLYLSSIGSTSFDLSPVKAKGEKAIDNNTGCSPGYLSQFQNTGSLEYSEEVLEHWTPEGCGSKNTQYKNTYCIYNIGPIYLIVVVILHYIY